MQEPLVLILARVLLVLAGLTHCACSPSRRPAVPEELGSDATVLDNPAIRTWDNDLSEAFVDELLRTARRGHDLLAEAGKAEALPPAYFLAISGGGANGAFGAGILCGWSATGTRPEFNVITGVSTGALTAPFAFLGSKYDDKLRQVYTSVATRDIFRFRRLTAALFDDALADTRPLRRLLESLLDEKMMHEIAHEYARGRLLLVATTNLDADRGVIWNIGAIAASNDPGALRLIHDVLMASAAIPGAFPPVMVDIELDGNHYQEMHVDGAAKTQVFLYPPSLELKAMSLARGVNRKRVAFIIRNAHIGPDWASVRRRALSIAGRAVGALVQSQGIGDLFRIYFITRRDHVEFNLAYIPESFRVEPAEHFDPVYMGKLFDIGYSAATAPGGYPWRKQPPGWTESEANVPPVTTQPAG